jgi:hypothetical protein
MSYSEQDCECGYCPVCNGANDGYRGYDGNDVDIDYDGFSEGRDDGCDGGSDPSRFNPNWTPQIHHTFTAQSQELIKTFLLGINRLVAIGEIEHIDPLVVEDTLKANWTKIDAFSLPLRF